MAGRGRGMTLPAWMTKGTASIGKPPAGSSATTPQPGASDKAAQSQVRCRSLAHQGRMRGRLC
eukprot:4456812-Ditylum_brightwellii.AAC.1